MIKAVRVLKDHGVKEDNIVFLNLFCTPNGNIFYTKYSKFKTCIGLTLILFLAASMVMKAFPNLTMLTSEVHPIAPNHFGQRYFGTD